VGEKKKGTGKKKRKKKLWTGKKKGRASFQNGATSLRQRLGRGMAFPTLQRKNWVMGGNEMKRGRLFA